MKIKEIREMSGLSQSQFSKKYEIPLRTLQKWEIDVRIPPAYVAGMLERIVKEDLKTE